MSYLKNSMAKREPTKKLSKAKCVYCKINHAEMNCAYCTFCREQMAKGNIKFDLLKEMGKR